MVKTLSKRGNSQCLVLDKPILEALGITADTKLQLSISGGSLTVTPINGGVGRERVRASLDRLRPRYGEMLKRLAE